MEVTFLCPIRMEAVDQHADDAEDERGCCEAVGLVPRIPQATNHGWEEIGDGSGDVDRCQKGHEKPHLRVCGRHLETLSTGDFSRVILLAEIGLEIPHHPFPLFGREALESLDRIGQNESEDDRQEDGDNPLDQEKLFSCQI